MLALPSAVNVEADPEFWKGLFENLYMKLDLPSLRLPLSAGNKGVCGVVLTFSSANRDNSMGWAIFFCCSHTSPAFRRSCLPCRNF